MNRRQFVHTSLGAAAAAAAGCAPCRIGPGLGQVLPPQAVEAAPLCQVAFSVLDVERTRGWYQDALGFLPSGGTNIFRGPIASLIQGLPRAASRTRWMVDQQEFRQLEMFQYESPVPKVRERPPNDIGYSMVGLHVAEFDRALARLLEKGVRPLTEPVGASGARRVCIRDPEGVLLELMEDDPREAGAPTRPRPLVPVAIRSVTLSVPDLDRSRRFFAETLGLRAAPDPDLLHVPAHEKIWGLEGARSRKLLLWAGDFLIELRQYTDPAGRPWPGGYRISDRGLLNVAFGFRSEDHFDRMLRRVEAAGYEANWIPFKVLTWGVVYVNDDQCFSVEMLWVEPRADEDLGFKPVAPTP
jgi:catechol 2,3-dioxygenase-like lactoylglutathione lyase family enzyme